MKTTYIILAAGKGSNLYPLTLKYSKNSYLLDENTSVIQWMIRSIKLRDCNSEIVVVLGFMSKYLKKELEDENVITIINPFYETTNSISSLWFAREYLERENVAIIHGDVVFSNEIIDSYLVIPTNTPYVLVDSNRADSGSYNVVTKDSKVLVMSKKLDSNCSRYACLTKLDPVSSRLLKNEIDLMVLDGMYNQYYEDALVQMIMFKDFELNSKDIAGKNWTEVDSVNDLLLAKNIHKEL